MCMKWKDNHKAKEESAVCKAEKEEASCKGKELACSGSEEDMNNEAACLFDDDVSPTCEAEEEEKKLMFVVKLAAKPVPTK